MKVFHRRLKKLQKMEQDQESMKNGDCGKLVSCLPMSARLRYSLAPGMSGMTGSRVPASNAVTRYRIPSNLIAYQGKMPSAPTLAVRKKRKDLMSKLHLKALWKGVTDEIALYKFLLRKPSYVLILISVTSLYFVLDVPYVFFYDYAVENLGAVESSAAHLTSIIGVTNLMSTWICGFVSDIECVKKRLFNFYGIAMFGLTMSYWMVPLVNSVFGMAVYLNSFIAGFIERKFLMQLFHLMAVLIYVNANYLGDIILDFMSFIKYVFTRYYIYNNFSVNS
uniref:MFS domain-containing protein n=1 Tax=Heterorhabditis bacteriophora TaxID=37862 RepID=A0A1I7X914_HETBA